jgi:hypothetical protein
MKYKFEVFLNNDGERKIIFWIAFSSNNDSAIRGVCKKNTPAPPPFLYNMKFEVF